MNKKSFDETLRGLMLSVAMHNKEPKEEGDVWSEGYLLYAMKDGEIVLVEDETPPKCVECGYLNHFNYKHCPDCGDPVE